MCKKRSAQNTRKKSRKQQIYQSRRLCEVRERVREEMCARMRNANERRSRLKL